MAWGESEKQGGRWYGVFWLAPGALPRFHLPWDRWVELEICQIDHDFKNLGVCIKCYQCSSTEDRRGTPDGVWSKDPYSQDRSVCPLTSSSPSLKTSLLMNVCGSSVIVHPIINKTNQVWRQLWCVLPFPKGEKHPGWVQQWREPHPRYYED